MAKVIRWPKAKRNQKQRPKKRQRLPTAEEELMAMTMDQLSREQRAALGMIVEETLAVSPRYGQRWVTLINYAFRLQQALGDKPFPLPLPLLAVLLGATRNEAMEFRSMGERYGFLRRIKGGFVFIGQRDQDTLLGETHENAS